MLTGEWVAIPVPRIVEHRAFTTALLLGAQYEVNAALASSCSSGCDAYQALRHAH